jgi:hypothetical protein
MLDQVSGAIAAVEPTPLRASPPRIIYLMLGSPDDL